MFNEAETKTLLMLIANMTNDMADLKKTIAAQAEEIKFLRAETSNNTSVIADAIADIRALNNDMDANYVKSSDVDHMIADGIEEHERSTEHMDEDDVDRRVESAIERAIEDFDPIDAIRAVISGANFKVEVEL